MAAVSGSALALLKLAKLLKGAKFLSGLKGAVAAKKAAGLGVSTAGKEYAKQQIAKQAAAQAGRMAGGNGFINGLGNAIGRAGYTKMDMLTSIAPDLALNVMYSQDMAGDGVDKGISILANTVGGNLLAGAGRSFVNVGKYGKAAARLDNAIAKSVQKGRPVSNKVYEMRDKLRGLQQSRALPMEIAGFGLGGPLTYEVGEKLQATKSYLSGDGFLSPTDKMFIEQDEAMKAELLAAYNAGQSAGARGGYFYDPYTGEAPLDVGEVYYGY